MHQQSLRIREILIHEHFEDFMTASVKKSYRRTLALVEFVPSPLSHSSTHNNEEHPDIVPSSAHDFSKKWAEVEKMGSDVKSISDMRHVI
jgi:hypothetical protein